MPKFPSLNRVSTAGLRLAVAALVVMVAPASAERVILHLNTGDRVSGVVMSEGGGSVVLSNKWASALTIPTSAITNRETIAVPLVVPPPVVPPPKPKPEAAPAPKPAPPTQAAAEPKKKAEPAPAPKPAPKPAVVAKAKPKKPAKPKRPPKPKIKHWSGNVNVGLNFLYGARDQQIYSADVRLNYKRLYTSDPKKHFNNAASYSVAYGRADGTKSTDRMQGSDKMDFDVARNWYAYNLAGVGFDRIRQIELQYEVGPGSGYHLFTKPKFQMNLEAGMDYQVQNRINTTDVEDLYYRLAQDLTWKITDATVLREKIEFFPRFDRGQYRNRFETTLTRELWKNLALNITIVDLYDTDPAPRVNKNELQIRSSIGFSF